MKLLTDLFSTNYGLMSIIGIAFMIGMGVFFILFFKHKMAEDAVAADIQQASASAKQPNLGPVTPQ
ncbi:MAG: DUF3149 domain-containing protein [Glaciimonas sp.]|nr:DUF3149 domain-containing protein [Glaciimonas sp.]